MTSITRRAVLKGSVATVAAGAVAASAVAHAEGDDSELISLINKWRRFRDECRTCSDDDRVDVLMDKMNEIEETVARLLAHSPEGIAGKLEFLNGWIVAGIGDGGIETRLLASAMKDLAVMGGGS